MKSVKKVFKIRVEAEGIQQAIVIIDEEMKVYGYPNSLSNPLTEDKHDNIFFMFDKETKSVNGYRYAGSKFMRIWNYYLASDVSGRTITPSNNQYLSGRTDRHLKLKQ